MTALRAPRTLVACALALVACGSSHTTASLTTRSGAHRAATTNTGRDQTASGQEFAVAYVRFLDGAGTASGLPDATSRVRAQAGRAGPTPAARRRGTLLITDLHPAVGAPDSNLLTARDDAHTFYAQMTLAHEHGRWVVVQLTPPDFVQEFAPAGPAPPGPLHGSAAAKDAARLFLGDYLPWLYGQAPLWAISATTSRLLANLKAHPPQDTPTMQSLAPTIAAIAMQRHDRGWQALPNISDGRETYELVLTVAQTRGRWLVNNVGSPR